MPEDDDAIDAKLPAGFEAICNECRTYALVAMCGVHRHRCEAHQPTSGRRVNRHGREEDVSDDPTLNLCDQRHEWRGVLAQNVNEMGFNSGRKGSGVQRMDLRAISSLFGSH